MFDGVLSTPISFNAISVKQYAENAEAAVLVFL